MKIISLFDGISGAAQALKELNIDCKYYASEIDKYAIQVSKANHPDIIQIGDVKNIAIGKLGKSFLFWGEEINSSNTSLCDFDLLIGGSPCQDLSGAGKGKGLDGERSGLFFKYLEILNEVKPKYFVLENVASMKKESRDQISELLGLEPIMINSNLLTAQNRKRYYWVGKLVDDKYEQVKIDQPEDSGIFLKDILEDGVSDREKSYCIDANYFKGGNLKSYFEKRRRQLVFLDKNIDEKSFGAAQRGRYSKDGKVEQKIEISMIEKSNCLTQVQKDSLVLNKAILRKLTPIECERLQGYPDSYTKEVSNSQRYKALGNSFTVPVIKHILQHLPTIK
jgi:DNA-cytosine methyltransferase